MTANNSDRTELVSYAKGRQASLPPFFARGSKMARLMRVKDWAATDVGPPENWPQNLRTAIDIILNSASPMFIWWGKGKLASFYNDAYAEFLGYKHPDSFGRPAQAVWSEAWNEIGPLAEEVFNTGKPGFLKDVKLIVHRFGRNERAYFTFSYSPIFSAGGSVEGLYCVCYETTCEVASRRAFKKALAKTDRVRRRLYNLFSMMGQGFCIIEMIFDVKNTPQDYRFIEVNSSFERQAGIKGAVGKTARELIPGLEKHWFEVYGGVALSGEPTRFTQYSAAMGRWFDIYAFRLGGQESRKIAILFTDITDRKQTEEALLASERRFRALVRASSDVVYRMSPDWSEMRQLEGRNFLADTGEPDREWIKKYIHPNDRRRVKRAIQKAVKNKTVFQLEHQVRQADGALGWTFSRAIPICDENGDIIEWFGAASDVTARKRAEKATRASEERLRFMAESMPQKIFTATSDGYINYCNPQWMHYSGREEKDILGDGWRQIVHPDDLIESDRQWRHSVATGEPFEVEYRFRRHDGVYRWHVCRAHALRNSKGAITQWIGSSTDVEEVKRTAARKQELEAKTRTLQLQRSQLLALNNAKDEFISLASHQLRTPASAVKLFIGMAIEGYAGEISDEVRALLQRAQESNERQITTINDLLHVAQIDAGKVRLHREPADVIELIRDVLKECAGKFQERQQKATMRTKKKVIIANIDRDRMRMVLENLIDNASKYTEEGKRITVTTAYTETNVLISVRDEGVGIDKADIYKLYKKFSRLDNPRSVLVGGTGLGLYWVKKIIDLHEGTISVVSTPGEGSTFTVMLPAGVNEQQG